MPRPKKDDGLCNNLNGWKSYEVKLPLLADVASHYQCILPSSASSELFLHLKAFYPAKEQSFSPKNPKLTSLIHQKKATANCILKLSILLSPLSNRDLINLAIRFM